MATTSPSQLQTDLFVNGQLSCKSFTPPAGSILDASIAAAAGIQATKCQREYVLKWAQESTTTAFAETRVVHVVYGATAVLVAFYAGCVTPPAGNATATLSLKKNGGAVANTTVTLTSTTAAYALGAPAGFAMPTSVGSDVWELAITVFAGTGTLPKGVFGVLGFREDPF